MKSVKSEENLFLFSLVISYNLLIVVFLAFSTLGLQRLRFKNCDNQWQYGPHYNSTNAHRFAVILSHKAISLLLSFSKTKQLLDSTFRFLNLITEVVGSPPASGTEHLMPILLNIISLQRII